MNNVTQDLYLCNNASNSDLSHRKISLTSQMMIIFAHLPSLERQVSEPPAY